VHDERHPMRQLGTMQRRSRRSLPRRPNINPPVPHAEFRQGLYHEAGALTEAGAGREFTNHRDAAVWGWRIAGNSGRSEGSQRTEEAPPRTGGQKPPSLVQRRDAILAHAVTGFPNRRLPGNGCRMR
jgi:hypothetical protein